MAKSFEDMLKFVQKQKSGAANERFFSNVKTISVAGGQYGEI